MPLQHLPHYYDFLRISKSIPTRILDNSSLGFLGSHDLEEFSCSLYKPEISSYGLNTGNHVDSLQVCFDTGPGELRDSPVLIALFILSIPERHVHFRLAPDPPPDCFCSLFLSRSAPWILSHST